jgi:hypothetical protein
MPGQLIRSAVHLSHITQIYATNENKKQVFPLIFATVVFVQKTFVTRVVNYLNGAFVVNMLHPR